MTAPQLLAADGGDGHQGFIDLPPSGLDTAAVNALITAQINALLNGAGAAYDTLKELQDLLVTDESTASALAITVAGKQPLHAILTSLAASGLAANKLAYGSGANAFSLTDLTAYARTLLGMASKAAVQSELGIAGGSGTAFPSGPAAGDQFFRTDRGIDYYYDGTRWLSKQLFVTTFANSARDPGTSLTVGIILGVNPIPWLGTYSLWLDHMDFSTQIGSNGSSNSTNHWTYQLNYYTNVGARVLIAGVDTRTIPNTGNGVITASIQAALSASATNFEAWVNTKTGSPSNYYPWASDLFYRLIG